MGILDQIIGSVLSQALGGGGSSQPRGGPAPGGQLGEILSSPIAKAILMMLIAKGMSGGFGNILGGGGGQAQPSGAGHAPSPRHGDGGDLGGFGGGGGSSGGGAYGDLSGMLDGPGGGAPSAQAGGASGPAIGNGLDGLIESFQRSGLGDVIGSWIAPGQNRGIAPNQLADALGHDTVDNLSSQTGLDRNELLNQLAHALPQVIDALTPHGRVPEHHERQGW